MRRKSIQQNNTTDRQHKESLRDVKKLSDENVNESIFKFLSLISALHRRKQEERL